MNKELLKILLRNLSNTTGRAQHQVHELLQLCGYDLKRYIALEEAIVNNFLHYAPGDAEEVDKIMSLPPVEKPFRTWDEWRVSGRPNNRWVLEFFDRSGKSYEVSVPPTDGNRVDIIANPQQGGAFVNEPGRQWQYHCGCKSGDHKGVEIHIVNGRIVLPVTT